MSGKPGEPGAAGPETIAAWCAFGLGYHAYACVLNDMADAATDRLDPSRAAAPLVGGPLTAAQALRAAFLLGAALLTGAVFAPSTARLPLAGLIVLVTYGNIRQKRSEWVAPWVMDALFGVAMAAPIVVVAAAETDGRVTGPVYWFAALFGVQLDLFNGVAGNLKDLRHDLAVGARTTAIAFGVHPDESGVVRFTAAYRRYCSALLAMSAAASVGVIIGAHMSAAWTATLCAGVAVCQLHSSAGLRHLLTSRRPPSRSGRELFLIGQFATVFLLLAAFIAPAEVLVLLAAVVGWTVLFPRLERFLARPSITPIPEAE